MLESLYLLEVIGRELHVLAACLIVLKNKCQVYQIAKFELVAVHLEVLFKTIAIPAV